jgi:hypothetical protein
MSVDPEVRAELDTVIADLERVQREVLDPLLRRAFVVAVKTQRHYPTGCDAEQEETFHTASGWTRLMDAIDDVENAALTAGLDGPKYATPVTWYEDACAELGLNVADVSPAIAVRFEREPMFELEYYSAEARRLG